MDDLIQNNRIDNVIERIKTGIDGLDTLVQGGLPKGTFAVVTGGPGTGKTIFALQFLANGALKYNEKGLFITAEQNIEDIVSQAKQFGWELDQMENTGKIKIVSLIGKQIFEDETMNEIKQLIQENHYERIVFDSITSLLNAPFSKYSIVDHADRGLQPHALSEMSRANVINFIDFIKKQGITTVGISQKIEGLPGNTIDNVSEFKADALIILKSTEMGDNLNRTIQVKKMRKTKIVGVPYDFDFTENGISIQENEE
jgi:circadian clock protein KaiC